MRSLTCVYFLPFQKALAEASAVTNAQAAADSMQDDAVRLQSLAMPTLVLWGGRDRLIPSAIAARFAADIRGARLVTFPDLGHVPQEEDPPRTVQPVLEFLEIKR